MLTNFPNSTAILLGSLLISVSILISGGVIKIRGVNIPSTSGLETTTTKTTDNTPTPSSPPSTSRASVDDDPVLGNADAPITIVEFSDYECPFCKRHFTQTLPQLKKDYIDTGKVKLVYRDLPLSFHDPMATTEAIAANCAREQGGDETYFKYHDELFKRTTSNGNGLTKDNLYQIAADLSLNSANFASCLDSEKYKDEVAKDSSDAQTAGASGTPSFIIGKSGNEIEGELIVGAQPFFFFLTVIDDIP